MSRDIRSFFLSKKPQKSKDEDDDVIPESPDVQIKNKKKEARKKRVIEDSDDESNTKKKKPVASNKSPKNKDVKGDLKEVKIVDLFGNAPIKRTEPLVKKVKKQTETGIHSDEEFEKSLLEIDNVEKHASETKQSEITESELNVEVATLKTSTNKHREKSPDHKKALSAKDKAKQNYANKKEESKLNSKRKFSEFTETEGPNEEDSVKRKKINDSLSESKIIKQESEECNEADISAFEDESANKSKKKRANTSLNESVLTDEERHERKMHSVALYKKYLNRSGPKHLGAKEIPEGLPDCLKNCAFLLTGVLDSFEREEIVDAINNYGGCVKNTISKKVTHVLAGEDAGPAKMTKAQELGIKIINEDEFVKMISDSKKSKNIDYDRKEPKDDTDKKNHSNKNKKRPRDKNLDKSLNHIKSEKNSDEVSKKNEIKKEKSSDEIKTNAKNQEESNVKSSDSDKTKKEIKTELKDVRTKTSGSENAKIPKDIKREGENQNHVVNAAMWVEKYKPQNVKQIIGQHGDASNVKKLTNWLTKWYVNRKAKLPKPSPWAKNDDGGYYKAALLSGPPGVGKTTTVSLVCKEMGFDMVEYNASDTRNKTLIKEQIGEMLTTTSLSAYAKGDTGKQAVTKKHVLVMDEVDGMAGNEDRGGLQELINLIKMTSVPIICMCNDRNSQKMRSLVNYCYDLRFSRPRVDQIKSAMMSICFKEGLKVAPDVLSQLIVAANQDVRQTLNLLSMWAVDPGLADTDRLRNDAKTIKKDIKLGPWEAVRKVFSAEDHKTMSIHDKSDLFFYDYSLAPLFVQENYLQVAPHCPKPEVLLRISRAADSISLGDLVDKRIRSAQAWSLLPTQAMYSSVIPGHEMAGHVAGQIQFPGWLGKNSRAGKLHRLCQEIHAHTRLSTSGSKSSIFLDYCTHLRDAIVNPLIKDKSDGIAKSLEVLESYHLLREDLESLVELSVWPGQRNPTILVDSKVKAAMTRTYNKTASALPYAPGTIKKGATRDEDEINMGDDGQHSDEPEDSDPENDALIKKKKTKDSEKPATNKDKAGTSKEKASSSKAKGSNKAKKK